MNPSILLTNEQQHTLDSLTGKKTFLHGIAGTGKTTLGISYLESLIFSGIACESLLVLVPQRPLGRPYSIVNQSPNKPAGGDVAVLTIGGLSRRMVDLFWPMVADSSGFSSPEKKPHFLTIETTQYFLSLLVDPLREQGYFDGISIEPARLYGQILDNLNKSAVIGFPPDEIASRLRSAWSGNSADARFFDQAQECALKFRAYCLENNLLDFSLQLQIFTNHLWHEPACREYLTGQYRHLIYDNVEEDYPIAHDLVLDWLPAFSSALMIMDDEAGYRSFLGADPVSANRFADSAVNNVKFTEPIITPPTLVQFSSYLCQNIRLEAQTEIHPPIYLEGINLRYSRFYTQMLDAVCDRIQTIIKADTFPGEIAVLSPFISDSLRFSLQNRLAKININLTTHRPGREFRTEPAVRCLVTLAKLAYPQFGLPVTPEEFRMALLNSIDGLDLIRAEFLKQTIFSTRQDIEPLRPFSVVKSPMNERITFQVGEKYEQLRNWILTVRENPPDELDIFFTRCFGELLSQKGFRFHNSYDYADATDRLIESARSFINTIRFSSDDLSEKTGFLIQIENGFTGAIFLPPWEENRTDAVLLSPAHTFLMRNRAVRHQLWLDPGSSGWWERLNQPLTHPVVLSRNWPLEKKWTDAEEVAHNQKTIVSLTSGLITRCSHELDIFAVLIDEQGNEPRGPLLQAINRFLRYHPGGLKLHDA